MVMNEETLAKAIAEAIKSGNGKAPWWSKDFRVMGPIAAIALVLVGQLAGLIPNPFAVQHAKIENAVNEGNRILGIMCERDAKTEFGKLACKPNTVSFAKVDDYSILTTVLAGGLSSGTGQ